MSSDAVIRLGEYVDRLEVEDGDRSDDGGDIDVDSPKNTDLGNAVRMVLGHSADLRFCGTWRKWLAWDRARWAIDDSREVDRRAQATVKAILLEAAALYRRAALATDKNDQRAMHEQAEILFAHGMRSQSAQRLVAMVQIAGADLRVAVRPDQLDTQPMLLNVTNGTIDLRTGELRAHRREDLLTQMAPVLYDPSAPAPAFERFVLEVTGGRQHLVDYQQRLLGYAITGLVREHVLPFLYGGGANGKTTLLNAIRDVLGPDYSCEAMPDLLMQKRNEQHSTERAHLFGKRLVSTTEVDENRRLAEVLVKQLTGGDEITARRMREDPWSFKPTHKLFLAGNHKPEIRGTDDGIWRRIHLVPFEVSFKGREDRTLPERLRAERAGILAWLVRGCLAWQREGLKPPTEVIAAVAEYRSEMDPIGDFIADRCVTGSSFSCRAGQLYGAYADWHKATAGGEPMTQTAFGRRLTALGYPQDRTEHERRRRGIGLRADREEREL